MKRIAHIDLNCFFVQCEILSDPSLKGKAVAIGRNSQRGVISTSSYEARAFGVNSGMPVSSAKQKCASLILIDGHYPLYVKYSHLFFSFLKERFPILEKASIDECFIDMTQEIKGKDENDFLFDLQMLLYRCTQLKCSIGLSHNRFLAKMASDMKKPLGITILEQEQIPSLLWPLSIEKFYGIGKKTAPRLKEAGILTIGDLAKCDDNKIKDILGSSFYDFKDMANGKGSSFVDNREFNPKSISSERTFLSDEENYDDIASMIHSCCKEITNECHKHKKVSSCVVLKWRTPDFVTKSKRITLNAFTDEMSLFEKAAMSIFDSIYHGQSFRLIGVGLERVTDKEDLKKEENQRFLDDLKSKLEKKVPLVYLDEVKHGNKE